MVKCIKCGRIEKDDNEGQLCTCGGIYAQGKVGAGKKCTMIHKTKSKYSKDNRKDFKRKCKNWESEEW